MAELISAGPSSFATEGERNAAALLQQQLPANWLIICNKILPDRDRSHEIDFIIVAQNWIFLLDEKSWHGKIRGDDEQWIRYDGSAERSPLAKIDLIAKKFAGYLNNKLTRLKGEYFVRGGVLLSLQEALPPIYDSRARNGVFLLNDVAQRLQKLDQQDGTPLVGQLRDQIKEQLLHFSNRPAVPKSISTYQIQEAINLRPNVHLFHATAEGDPNDPRLLFVYNLGQNPLEAQELHNFYKREYLVIRKLRSTGLVPEVKDSFIWSEDYLVVPIVPPAGRSLKATPLPETHDEFKQDLQLAIACFKGLDQIHKQGVVHRALGPETIYVSNRQSARITFTNFYAARLGTNTIAARLDQNAREDPYAALNVAISYEFATPQTDTISLALVWLERLSGTLISKLRPIIDEDRVIIPDQPRWSSFLDRPLGKRLASILLAAIQPADEGTATATASEVAQQLTDLLHEIEKAEAKGKSEIGRILCKDYEVLQVLGQGAMARTYLVKNIHYPELNPDVLKRFLSEEEVIRQAVAEYRALQNFHSKYVPAIRYIYQPGNDAHILMEYIPGTVLEKVKREFPWPIERWWSFASDLLQALQDLEEKGVLHRDIKPANIILHKEDNHPVLIDFGFATKVGQHERIAGTPLYLPPETSPSDPAPVTGDRYAAAIVLFQALTGQLPFTISSDGNRTMIPLDQLQGQQIRRLAAKLQQAVTNDPAERPTSAAQLKETLQQALQSETVSNNELEKQINPWVENIRSLYRNSDSGNANNRGLDSDFVRETYIPTALDTRLLPLIIQSRPAALFLSGNPGDGKTAFLEQVYQKLLQQGATLKEKDPSGWTINYNGHIFRSCYDASESQGEYSADEQLSTKLQGLEGEQPEQSQLTVLIAINDGRLVDFFQRKREQFPWLAQHVEQAGELDTIEQAPVWLIDLKQRAFVGLPDDEAVSIFRQLLATFVQDTRWSICEQCSAQAHCPLRKNAAMLRKRVPASRLEYLFLLTHLRRLQHITMRDLRSAIAYILTGNKNCQDIHAAESNTPLNGLTYWQNVFAPGDRQDELLNTIATLNPARFPQPQLDRFLYFHQSESDAPQRRLLFRDRIDLSRQRFVTTEDWLAAIKRSLYFENAKKGSQPETTGIPTIRAHQLLPYRHADRFVEVLHDNYEHDFILNKLAQGLLHSDEVFEDVPDGRVSIKVTASEPQQLVILKQLPLADFTLNIEQPPHAQLIETLPEIVTFQHKSGTPRIQITLDLFELLVQLAEGLQPGANEYAPLLEDLKPFKNALLMRETQELVLIESEYRTHHIVQRNGKIILEQVQA